MLNFIDKYKNSEFGRNVLKLASGSTVAQIIAIACAPIVYRIYERSDYGLLGLFMATAGVISVFSTMQYLNTILIAADDEEAKISMLLNRFINIILSLICCLFVIFIFFITPNLLNFSEFGLYVFLLPISIFLNGQNEIFRVFANRKKEYNLILTNTILISVISPLISIPTGLLVNGPFGLFFSLIIGQITAYFFLSFRLKRTYNLKLSFKNFKE